MLNKLQLSTIDWKKIKGLIPVIIQSHASGEVLMHGYMNKLALKTTIQKKIVTFFSRTKQRLWTKGETSGNFLKVIDIFSDCDNDTLLIKVFPIGKTCHFLKNSCFNLQITDNSFLFYFEKMLEEKKKSNSINSYTSNLFSKGVKRIAQKVGEEAVEVILAAMVKNNNKELIDETTDLFYHLLVLLHSKNISFREIICNLKKRSCI
ncbi:histidine biosynthesis bifunctional protein [Buchnera aphidicola (Nipponaphis monzeni)]|uniref:Histidine biosynthesis bifunctional protein HisIE n=1 Tax=Buchnera aphidicola (Nipponaphis monzeni) TaxID=2495405 RepID=A0A455T9V0_9GAMM|nr:bifunctional phosphoribosyl-AMP cyclohydrolase/phosphoribosyl-ATP diphosphatase HisIE [Buchnera aphidicola]BBI01104.1 histidine biosynthesis bifunctional protein [Buchnera aphidicola (Nipponaphis monzeni)]